MKWKNLLKKIAIAGTSVATPGPIALAVNEILGDDKTDNSQAFELIAAAIDGMEKRIKALEQGTENSPIKANSAPPAKPPLTPPV